MSKAQVLITVLIIMLIAFSNDLPPPPHAPEGTVTKSQLASMVVVNLPTWATTPSAGFITQTTDNQVEISTTGDDYIFREFHITKRGTKGWQTYTFDQNTVRNSQWIAQSASKTLSLEPGEYYIITYACTKRSGIWDCHNNKWMLQNLVIPENLPEMPPGISLIENDTLFPDRVGGSTLDSANSEDKLSCTLGRPCIRYLGIYKMSTQSIIPVAVDEYHTEIDEPLYAEHYDLNNQHPEAIPTDQNQTPVYVWVYGPDQPYPYVVILRWTSGNKTIEIDVGKEIMQQYGPDGPDQVNALLELIRGLTAVFPVTLPVSSSNQHDDQRSALLA